MGRIIDFFGVVARGCAYHSVFSGRVQTTHEATVFYRPPVMLLLGF